ncbi:hypothetical protein MAR_013431 [Mya arenaria]|uniref:Uncharacterized protein n=1 Tax=Mya arenaria TaxID=6604 RepID=A0ABY7FZW7_MYAAR|nr:hypothetical protein MAR_013431 [Mya arenaria]
MHVLITRFKRIHGFEEHPATAPPCPNPSAKPTPPLIPSLVQKKCYFSLTSNAHATFVDVILWFLGKRSTKMRPQSSSPLTFNPRSEIVSVLS